MERTEDQPNAWILGPVGNCVKFLGDELVFLATVERAFSAFTTIPLLLKIVSHLPIPEETRQLLQNFAELSREPIQLADQFTSSGMRNANIAACVSAWAALETTIEETLVNHLLQLPSLRQSIETSIPSLAGTPLQNADDARAFIRVWERKLRSTNVVDRAVDMLSILQLPIEISDGERRALTELSEFRNLAVHRRSVVDEKFRLKVPWSDAPIGEPYPLDRQAVEKFFEASQAFTLSLLRSATASPHIFLR